MKINEFAIIEPKVDEAPIGAFKRAMTGIAGFFGSAGAKEDSKVQSAINAMYKEYKQYYTPTPEGRPTGENLKAFITATGYPLEKKYGSLSGLYAQVEKVKKMRNQKPVKPTEPDAQAGDDNTVPFPKANSTGSTMVQGTYEALDIKSDSVLSNAQVEDMIEFIVRDSFRDDKVKDLAPGAYTAKLRRQNNKKDKEQAQQKATAQTPSATDGELVKGNDGIFRFQ
tara:strand:+ start:5751 stop:6425 length:675 start_codon:yes stop_codon:yes gene_type:complete